MSLKNAPISELETVIADAIAKRLGQDASVTIKTIQIVNKTIDDYIGAENSEVVMSIRLEPRSEES